MCLHAFILAQFCILLSCGMVFVTTTASRSLSSILRRAGPEKMPCVKMAYTLAAPASCNLNKWRKKWLNGFNKTTKKLIHFFTSKVQIMHSKDAYKHWYVLDLGSNWKSPSFLDNWLCMYFINASCTKSTSWIERFRSPFLISSNNWQARKAVVFMFTIEVSKVLQIIW